LHPEKFKQLPERRIMPLPALNTLNLITLDLRNAKAGYADTFPCSVINNVVHSGWLSDAGQTSNVFSRIKLLKFHHISS
jgi:hypothetical protein